MTLIEILSHFKGVVQKSRNRYEAHCPAHDDKHPSFSIYVNNDWVNLHCFAGCTEDEILRAVGLSKKDLFIGERKSDNPPINSIVYNYYDENGELGYQKQRLEYADGSKKLFFISPDGTPNIKGKRHLIYNLPEVMKSDMVYFVEGEKCSDCLIKQGLVATTLDSGANTSLGDEWIGIFKGKAVIIIPDNDSVGRNYARRIKRKIPWAVIKELPELAEKEDIYDWLSKGHSVTEIDSLPETEYPEGEHPETEQKADQEKISTYKKSQGKLMLELFEKEGVEIFFNENNTPFVEFPVGEHSEVYPLDSSTFRQWAEMVFNQYTDKTIKRDGLNEALSIISAKSKFSDTPIHIVHNRVADSKSDFWYDLSNKSWTAVRTNTEGWSIEKATPKFYRYTHQKPQVTPVEGGNIEDIFQFINLTKHKTLFLCWLVSCFVPDIPHPMPIIFGEKGAAKSTACMLLKELIDPSVLETLSLSKDERSLIVSLQQHYYLPFDNVSSISNDMSDTLCRAITGGAIQQRKLFTNSEDCIFTFKRCLTINGINNVANKSDLLDRSILFELERVSEENRIEAQTIYRDFKKRCPYILGAIFTLLSSAMKIYPTAKLNELSRMADFSRWGYAIGEALGNKGEEFLSEYNSNRQIQNQEAINADSVASLVVDYMEHKTTWSGRISDLFRELKQIAEGLGINPTNKSLPQAPNHLSRRIKSVRSNLEQVGITFDIEQKSDGSYITLSNNYLSKLPAYHIDPVDILNKGNGDTGDNGDNSYNDEDVEF